MSVTMGSANVDPPPLLFGQRSVSPPSFTSAPLSPNNSNNRNLHSSQNTQLESEDVEMSTSVVLQPPAGQNHDREDQDMTELDDSSGGDSHNPVQQENQTGDNGGETSERPVESTTGESMDIIEEPPANVAAEAATDAAEPPETSNITDTPTNPEQQEPTTNEETGGQAQADNTADPANPFETTQAEPATTNDAEQSQNSSSSTEDSDAQPQWEPLPEDTSVPDEAELKEIEERGDEKCADDREHWEKVIFTEVQDPEYTAGPSGTIEWIISNYQGTKESPNTEVIMKSPIVNIGGLDWQIKFYPKGNDSDYLSVYVECLSMVEKSKDEQPKDETGESVQQDKPVDIVTETKEQPRRHLPLPTMESDTVPGRPSIAAQVGVVLYNPSEPRVHSYRTCKHRFCGPSPDWGWTRFHGPYYEIQHRQRGQRQALLRNDTLAFTAYIRLVSDSTNCLWEHTSHENPWDSFTMTGLRAMSMSDRAKAGSLISAVTTWLMFKPFRTMLYQMQLPDPEKEPLSRPKPLLTTLQKILYLMRAGDKTKKQPVQLDDLLYALLWYGIKLDILKTNVMDIWDILKIKIIEELNDELLVSKFISIFGTPQDPKALSPSMRIPVKGFSKIQDSLNHIDPIKQDFPSMLAIELDRQNFDESAKCYKKIVSKIAIDEHIEIGKNGYTLYGIIAHKEDLQSGRYYPILRPEGPGSNWYKYSDGKHGFQVRCIPQSEALGEHEGSNSGNESSKVAYIAMYVTDEVVPESIVKTVSEPWSVPAWLIDEIEKESSLHPEIPRIDSKETVAKEPGDDKMNEEEDNGTGQTLDFHIINSGVFLQHEGPGTIDTYDPKWRPDISEFVHNVQLNSKDSCKDVRQKLAASMQIDDPRQCKFWFIDSYRGMENCPNLLSTGSVEISSGSLEVNGENWRLGDIRGLYPERRIWVHILDKKELPPLPTPVETSNEPESTEPQAQTDASQPNPDPPQTTEDTPMEGSDERQGERAPQEASTNDTVVNETSNETSNEQGDTSATNAATTSADLDTAMEESAPAPPSHPPVPQEVPPERTVQDEIYFFLKIFDVGSQKLLCKGSYIAKKSDRLDEIVREQLSLPTEKEFELYEEEDIRTANPLNPKRSFAQNDLHNTAVVIVHYPANTELLARATAESAELDPPKYLSTRALQRNFPHLSNGLFTFTPFGSEYYSGEMRNHYFHGQGTRKYFDGSIYSGNFALSRRHGRGYMQFPNGDTYDGEWSEGQQHGKGTYVESATENTYVGGWKQGKRFGEGVTHWKVAHESERPCRICWEEDANAAFYDCGHVVSCLGCARHVDTCPICRKRVISSIRLFYAT